SSTAPGSLRVLHLPNPVVQDFQQFAYRLDLWIDKQERVLLLEIEQRRKEEQAQARAREQAEANKALTQQQREAKAAAQIAAWRQEAGFQGSFTEASIGPQGELVWFLDLDGRGRIIVHGQERTFHGSLRGARVADHGDDLELAVRDDYWSEDDPQLTRFRVLAGAAPASRLAWLERLQSMIVNLG
ncbi:MAG: hypothetical protein ACR2I0_06375, partial [Rhodoferax sp.]